MQEHERLSQRQTGQPLSPILLDLDGTDDPTHGVVIDLASSHPSESLWPLLAVSSLSS